MHRESPWRAVRKEINKKFLKSQFCDGFHKKSVIEKQVKILQKPAKKGMKICEKQGTSKFQKQEILRWWWCFGFTFAMIVKVKKCN